VGGANGHFSIESSLFTAIIQLTKCLKFLPWMLPRWKNAFGWVPFLWGCLITAVADDLTQYWYHRLHHEVPWLWHFHRTHHSASYMGMAMASRQNLIYEPPEPHLHDLLLTNLCDGNVGLSGLGRSRDHGGGHQRSDHVSRSLESSLGQTALSLSRATPLAWASSASKCRDIGSGRARSCRQLGQTGSFAPPLRLWSISFYPLRNQAILQHTLGGTPVWSVGLRTNPSQRPFRDRAGPLTASENLVS
jgi:Fatty acid hydroxylase superfamily